jgi:hypothetical protein
MPEFGAPKDLFGSLDLSEPEKRLRDLDVLGIDAQLLFPSSLYACMGSDPFFEAAMFRAYNRYAGRQCKAYPKRLKWAGLLPLRDASEAIAGLSEMQALGASAAVVFGTVGERLLSHRVSARSGTSSRAQVCPYACTWVGAIRRSISWWRHGLKPT